MEFTNQYNFELKPEHCEKIEGQSLTVPDEAKTIQELFQRANQGIIDTTHQNVIWEDSTFDDVDLEKISRLDLTEISEQKIRILREELMKLDEDKTDEEKAVKTKKANDSEVDKYDVSEENKNSKESKEDKQVK